MPYSDSEKAREYQHQWHLRTWKFRKEKHHENRDKRRFELRKWFIEYKSQLSCLDCKENHIACIDFHHPKDNKKHNIGDMVSQGFSKEKILEEIKKCIPICRNCHAKRHYNQSVV